jgi:hypothetical protein
MRKSDLEGCWFARMEKESIINRVPLERYNGFPARGGYITSPFPVWK